MKLIWNCYSVKAFFITSNMKYELLTNFVLFWTECSLLMTDVEKDIKYCYGPGNIFQSNISRLGNKYWEMNEFNCKLQSNI